MNLKYAMSRALLDLKQKIVSSPIKLVPEICKLLIFLDASLIKILKKAIFVNINSVYTCLLYVVVKEDIDRCLLSESFHHYDLIILPVVWLESRNYSLHCTVVLLLFASFTCLRYS